MMNRRKTNSDQLKTGSNEIPENADPRRSPGSRNPTHQREPFADPPSLGRVRSVGDTPDPTEAKSPHVAVTCNSIWRDHMSDKCNANLEQLIRADEALADDGLLRFEELTEAELANIENSSDVNSDEFAALVTFIDQVVASGNSKLAS